MARHYIRPEQLIKITERRVHYPTADWKDEDGTQWTQRALSTNADDQTQSEEGETLKAIERICQKCERDGHPHKFPEPANAYHAILVDFRTFLDGSSDTADMEHIALGGTKLADVYKRYWKGELIKGVFEVKNTLRGAQTLRDRVHFIGFVHEKAYEAGEFERSIYWVANPHRFETEQEAITARASLEIQDTRISGKAARQWADARWSRDEETKKKPQREVQGEGRAGRVEGRQERRRAR